MRASRVRVGDWMVALAVFLAALLFVAGTASAVISLGIQRENHTLVQQVDQLTKDNAVREQQNSALIQEIRGLAREAAILHQDNLIVAGDLERFCATYHVTCTVVKGAS